MSVRTVADQAPQLSDGALFAVLHEAISSDRKALDGFERLTDPAELRDLLALVRDGEPYAVAVGEIAVRRKAIALGKHEQAESAGGEG